MGPNELVVGLAGLLLGATLGALALGPFVAGGREHDPLAPDLGAPGEKPKHVHIWHRTSAEQTNRATRWVYRCYDCPAREVRELEA